MSFLCYGVLNNSLLLVYEFLVTMNFPQFFAQSARGG